MGSADTTFGMSGVLRYGPPRLPAPIAVARANLSGEMIAGLDSIEDRMIIAVALPSFAIAYINRAALTALGYEMHELLFMHLDLLVRPGAAMRHRAAEANYARTRTSPVFGVHRSVTLLCKDGGSLRVSLTIEDIKDETSNLELGVAFMTPRFESPIPSEPVSFFCPMLHRARVAALVPSSPHRDLRGSMVERLVHTLKMRNARDRAEFMKSVVLPRSLFSARARILAVYGFYAMLVFCVVYSGVAGYLWSAAVLNLEPVVIFVMFFECGVLWMAMCGLGFDLSRTYNEQAEVVADGPVAVLVCCHNSEDVVRGTLTALLAHVGPQAIWVCDNGNTVAPPDGTPYIAKEFGVNYMWGAVGNKTVAQWRGLAAARAAGYELVALMDDDMTLPEAFVWDTCGITERGAEALAYSIAGTDRNGTQPTWFIRQQDIEYKLCDTIKAWQSECSSVQFPHGALSLWKACVLEKVLLEHDCVFYGDDVKMGITLSRMGLRMGLARAPAVPTEVPVTVCGSVPNFWTQRVRSWDSAEHMLFSRFVGLLVHGHVRGSVLGTVLSKCFSFYTLGCIVSDMVRIPALVAFLAADHRPWSLVFGLAAAHVTTVLVWSRVVCSRRSDLRPALSDVLSHWVYKLFSSGVRVFGMMRWYCFSFPLWRAPNPMRERLKIMGDLESGNKIMV